MEGDTPEMVERVGKAIVETLETCGDADIQAGVGTIFGLGSAPGREAFIEMLARAAIEAHEAALAAAGLVIVPREPTEAMIAAGTWADIPGGRHGESTFRESSIDEADAPVIYRAMIGAAPERP